MQRCHSNQRSLSHIANERTPGTAEKLSKAASIRKHPRMETRFQWCCHVTRQPSVCEDDAAVERFSLNQKQISMPSSSGAVVPLGNWKDLRTSLWSKAGGYMCATRPLSTEIWEMFQSVAHSVKIYLYIIYIYIHMYRVAGSLLSLRSGHPDFIFPTNCRIKGEGREGRKGREKARH